MQFIKLAFFFGLLLGMMGFGGLLARAHFGSDLYLPEANPNQALPLLFIELFPSWLAALIGIGVLSAVMSTADGLVVSSSQIVANDIYRRTIVPVTSPNLTDSELDKRVLKISRVATMVILVFCMVLAWALMDKNVALIVWIGTGGMMAAFAGPLVVGALWRGVTKAGAYSGLLLGFLTFVFLHSQTIDPSWFPTESSAFFMARWLYNEGPNPYSCAFMGELVSIFITVLVSHFSKNLPEEHLRVLFLEKKDPERV